MTDETRAVPLQIESSPVVQELRKTMRRRARRRALQWLRALALAAFLGLAAWILSYSWMKWMDVFIDFGREIYVPWRITEGEHLGRDFVHPYGPFSVYFNAAIYAVFGVSVRNLVIANLVIFGGIIFCLFTILRRSFGFWPAALVTSTCSLALGLGHFVGINNYTYALPYSHEATHGMLFLLLLLLWLGRESHWMAPRRGSWITGCLLGLCCLTKTEYVVTGLLTISVALWRLFHSNLTRQERTTWLVGFCGSFISVLALAWSALAVAVGPKIASTTALNAILAPLTFAEYSKSHHVLHFLGADQFAQNSRVVLYCGFSTLLALAAAQALARYAQASASLRIRTATILALCLGAAIAASQVEWFNAGRALPVLVLTGLAATAWNYYRAAPSRRALGARDWNQLLLLVAACGMLLRMVLAPKLFHYGFFQAILATAWILGYAVGKWPRLATTERSIRLTLTLSVAGIIIFAASGLIRFSAAYYFAKNVPLGVGSDRIFGYSPKLNPMPRYWEDTRGLIEKLSPQNATLLVIPEGLSLNYWLRQKQPLRIADTLPATLRMNGQDPVSSLRKTPPTWVVLATRMNIREMGIERFGQDEASGKQLLDWVYANYSLVGHAGSDPFVADGLGVRLFRLNAAIPPE